MQTLTYENERRRKAARARLVGAAALLDEIKESEGSARDLLREALRFALLAAYSLERIVAESERAAA